jgi:hypothetical protein
MATPELKEKIKSLQQKTNAFRPNRVIELTHFSFNKVTSSNLSYLAIIITTFLLLILFKPSVIMNENVDIKSKTRVKKLSLKKLLITWFLISAVLCASLFIYNFKSKKEN